MGIILKHILKCLVIAFPMLFVSTSMYAESKDSRISGYRGNLSFSITPEIESEVPIGIDITTSHGYSFGNGWHNGLSWSYNPYFFRSTIFLHEISTKPICFHQNRACDIGRRRLWLLFIFGIWCLYKVFLSIHVIQ